MARTHTSPGFTLIELPVVIAVIAALIGLLLPAVFANVCPGDGSARALKKNLDVSAFYAISTAQGGEVINSGDY